MVFNSLDFIFFFIVVLGLYFSLNHRWQNWMLLAASYFFYGCWDWRFLSLIFISTVVDYFCANGMARSADAGRRKQLLWISCISNLGMLGFFKYCDFFSLNFARLMHLIGLDLDPFLLKMLPPVGISFYTFQTMSYTIDVYRGKLTPTTNFLDFALFVSFFSQLVAGPVERASHLLPQVLKPRKVTLDGFNEGIYLIFWGLFEKVVIADNLAAIVNPVFAKTGVQPGAEVLLATYGFAFQIFCDFDGYSNIARGAGKCMGFDIMVNFNLPYFAKSPSDFWGRWHISLSTWLRDYLYIPLGGNRHGDWMTLRNLMLTMLLGGLWHGAAWHFVLWGFWHGLLLIGFRLAERRLAGRPVPVFSAIPATLKEPLKIIGYFQLTCVSWLLFRCEDWGEKLHSLLLNFSLWQFADPAILTLARDIAVASAVLIAVQLYQYKRDDLMAMRRLPWWARALFYYVLLMLILLFGKMQGEQFIYFQF
ncbi:MBOAT family protein [Candidatus Sumerlaeota bacterium]|nr:MBOAT family protein [Candidatus Sumerlaeota bacterium]